MSIDYEETERGDQLNVSCRVRGVYPQPVVQLATEDAHQTHRSGLLILYLHWFVFFHRSKSISSHALVTYVGPFLFRRYISIYSDDVTGRFSIGSSSSLAMYRYLAMLWYLRGRVVILQWVRPFLFRRYISIYSDDVTGRLSIGSSSSLAMYRYIAMLWYRRGRVVILQWVRPFLFRRYISIYSDDVTGHLSIGSSSSLAMYRYIAMPR